MGGSAGEEGGPVIQELIIRNADDPGRPLLATVNRTAVNELLNPIEGNTL